MTIEPVLDVFDGYERGEKAAVTALLKHCFGDTLPLDSRVSILRCKESSFPEIVHAVVMVDGQEIGAVAGSRVGQTKDGANVLAFSIFPKFSQ
jgi:hypothetical protein